jgi:signal transduction histidine kinase
VSVDIGQDAPKSIWGDPGRLSVVLSNVLTNAVKYTPPGGRIRVGAQPDRTAGKSHVCIEVTEEVSIYRVIGSPARPAASARATLGE